MVHKKDIIKIIDLALKDYNLKNHHDKFKPYTCNTVRGKEVTIEVLKLTEKPTFIKKIKEAIATLNDEDKWRVDVPSIDDLKDVDIYQTYNGCTFAVKPDGDIVSVCGFMGEDGVLKRMFRK